MKEILLILFLFIQSSNFNAQNTCVTAIPISAGTHMVDAVNGTQIPTPICAENGTGATAGEWYTYTPSQNYTVVVTTELEVNLNKDTRFHVYTGSCSTLVCHAGDDDSGTIGTGYLSISTFNVVAGTTYYIAFDNRWNSSGFTFELTENPLVLPVINFTASSISLSSVINCVVDMNNDYLDDIVTIQSNQLNLLTQKATGGFDTFNYPLSPTVLLPDWSIAAGDFDRNGFNDLALGNVSRVTILKANSNGTGYAVTQYPQSIFTQRTNFVDINNDGHLDLWACHDVAQSHAYRNDGLGNLLFDISLMPTLAVGGNYATMWTDYDNDGDIDLYLAKCRGGAPIGDPQRINLLYKNNGNGTFSEVGAFAGVNDGSQSWSTAIEDFDNDGDFDFLLSNISDTNKFYLNNGNGTFTDIYATTGIASGVGSWEIQAADFNNDGYVDFLWQNGKEIYINNGNLTFTGYDLTFNEGGIGDLNNDGFLDIQTGGTIYYNVPNANNWIRINLKGIQSNRNGIGARLELYGTWGKQIREIRSGQGFSHMSSLNGYFGIGSATSITKLIIRWPSGVVDTILNPAINLATTIVEGTFLSVPNINAESGFVLYPNPVKNELKIETKGGEKIIGKAKIFDLSGKLLQESSLENGQIEVQNLIKGIYFIQIEDKKGTKSVSKFIKE